MIIVQIYVDDIIFGSTNTLLCEEFALSTSKEFEMSLTGELAYMLGLQIKQREDDIFIYQEKYARELVKNLGLRVQTLQRLLWHTMICLTWMRKVKRLMSVNTEV